TEERAGRMLYRSFGTNLPGGVLGNVFRLHIKNAANTNIVYHAGRLLALWEGGLPHRLDPVTLDTLERDDFGAQLRNPAPSPERLPAPELPFSAHPKRDLAGGDLYNFGVCPGSQPRLLIYCVDERGLRIVRELPLDGYSFIH